VVLGRGGRDEPNASMASGMVLKAGLEVPFGCWWEGDIVGGCLVMLSSKVSQLTLQRYLQCMYRLDNGMWYGIRAQSLP
jgi:hypothetical protein